MKKRLIAAVCVLFWLAVWQVGAMLLGQELLLVSPVRAAGRLLELIPTEGFLRTDTRRLRAGADLRHSAGAPRGEIPLCADAPRAACRRRESRSGGEYHGSCAGVGQLPESFGAGDVPHRASGGVFKHAGEPRQHGPETH